MPTTEDLLARLRSDLQDPVLPNEGSEPDEDSLWSNDELISNLNLAQNELCVRCFLIPDSTSFAPTVTADDQWIDVDSDIVDIRRAYLTTAGLEIKPVKLTEIESAIQGDDYGISVSSKWRTLTGTPRFIVTDIELGKGRLVPIPTSGDTVELMTHRLPEEKIEDDDVDPVIDPQYHLDMLIWAKKLAYEKHDSETLDKKESVDFEMQWERRVAEINKRNKIKISGAGVVQYGGF